MTAKARPDPPPGRPSRRSLRPPPRPADDGEYPVALVPALSAAVPLWAEKVRAMTPSQRAERAHVCAAYVAAHGDALIYRSRPGATAEAFNRLAEGLAVAAFTPGGVTFAGMHFEYEEGPSRE
jgi:hypothetical protein